MRELNVYYCSKCGHYGFYQISRNAVCPICQNIMTILPMSYQSFMNLEYSLRDELIAHQLTENIIPRSSVVQRITELEHGCDQRFTAIRLINRIKELEADNLDLRQKNLKQEDTITWMHDMIWDLTARMKCKD